MKLEKVNIKRAVEIYNSKLIITNADICELFECCPATATKMLKKVRNEQIARGILPLSSNGVNIDVAFDTWGLDISSMERKFKKLKALGLA